MSPSVRRVWLDVVETRGQSRRITADTNARGDAVFRWPYTGRLPRRLPQSIWASNDFHGKIFLPGTRSEWRAPNQQNGGRWHVMFENGILLSGAAGRSGGHHRATGASPAGMKSREMSPSVCRTVPPAAASSSGRKGQSKPNVPGWDGGALARAETIHCSSGIYPRLMPPGRRKTQRGGCDDCCVFLFAPGHMT